MYAREREARATVPERCPQHRVALRSVDFFILDSAMKRFVILVLALAACADRNTERYGFVSLLGRDTVSVEAVARRGDAIQSDAVDRWPFVRQRHTEIVLAPDGSIRHFDMIISTPNAPQAKDRQRHVTADITADSAIVDSKDGNGTKRFAWPLGGALALPHVPQSYTLAERYIAAAMARGKATKLAAGDSVPLKQFYPDFDVSHFPLHDGWVHPLAGGKVEIWHDWLSGLGDAVVDSTGRLQSYSGERSTYKVQMVRIATLPDVEGSAGQMLASEEKTGASQLSVRDTARGTIGAATFSIDYGRPLARGRVLLGNVVRYDQVWRTGANAATQFTTSVPITLAGVALKAGMYTLWTVPRASGKADLVINAETGQWGTNYDDAHDVGMAALVVDAPGAPVEKFTMSVTSSDAKHGALVLEWGTFRWTAPIVVK